MRPSPRQISPSRSTGSRRRGPAGAGWFVAALLLSMLAAASDGDAHGGPVKVVDDRYAVTALLFPAGDATRLQFFVSEFRTGRVPQEPVSFRIRVVDDDSRAPVCPGLGGALETGRASAICRVPRDGFYEVFLEFWSDREPGRVYAPEDWRVWIGESRTGRGPATLLVLAAALATVSMGVSAWRRRGVARGGVR
jgi:hypothetical protein